MAAQPSGTVTFLLTDIEGSARLWEMHPARMRVALAHHNHLLIASVEMAGAAWWSPDAEADRQAAGAIDELHPAPYHRAGGYLVVLPGGIRNACGAALHHRALVIAGAAAALRSGADQISAQEEACYLPWLRRAEEALPAETARSARNEGAAMMVDEAIAYALEPD